jgi:hypothetical protein
MKVPVIQNNQFILYLEEVEGNLFIHCDILVKWSKEVKHNLQSWFERLTSVHGKDLYALHAPKDKKHEKFLRMFNFSYFNSFIGTDGNNYDIYIWR